MLPEALPPTIIAFFQHGGRRENYVAWWATDQADYFVLEWEPKSQTFWLWNFPQVVGHWWHQVAGQIYSPAAMTALLQTPAWEMPPEVRQRVAALIQARTTSSTPHE